MFTRIRAKWIKGDPISVKESERDVVVLTRKVSRRARGAAPPAIFGPKDTWICAFIE